MKTLTISMFVAAHPSLCHYRRIKGCCCYFANCKFHAIFCRYKRFTEEGNLKEAKQFLIDDFTKYPYDNLFDTSKIYVHNVLNPCLNSTYR